MTITLADYEKGEKYDGDYSADLAALQDRMTRIQQAHIIHGHRSIIMIEGWDAAGKGEIVVFDRSWYGRVLVERVEGYATDTEWKRAYDEINEFEAQQLDSGTHLIKLFCHVTQKEQDARFADRLNDPWKRWKTGADDYRNRSKRKQYLEAYKDMFKLTDTRWAPWKVLDMNNKKAGRIAGLTYVCEQL